MKFSQVIPHSRSNTVKAIAIVGAIVLPSVLAYAGYLAYTRFERKKYIKKIKSVVFLGDSQTVPENSWADLVAKQYGWRYMKHAKVGAKTDWALTQYQNDSGIYDAVVVMIGGNDVWATGKSKEAINNLGLIKSLARKRNHIVIFVSPPSKEFYSTDAQKLSEYNKIETWMKGNADVFVGGKNITNSSHLFASDSLHLNNIGQEGIAYEFVDSIQNTIS